LKGDKEFLRNDRLTSAARALLKKIWNILKCMEISTFPSFNDVNSFAHNFFCQVCSALSFAIKLSVQQALFDQI